MLSASLNKTFLSLSQVTHKLKGVITSRDMEGVSEEEICEHLSSHGVVSVRRIKGS